MTNKPTETTTTLVSSQQQQEQLVVDVSEPPKNPIFPFLNNFNFNFKIPDFFNPPKHHHGADKNKATPKVDNLEGQNGPNVVTFPKSQPAVAVSSPLQAEADAQNSTAKTSNPIIIYQVYAIGAFFISRWLWARWNERKAQGGSPNDDGPGAQNNE